MFMLAQKFCESIEERNSHIASQHGNNLPNELDPEQKMNILVDLAEKIQSVRNGARGNRNDFIHDFVRGVCSKTLI